MLRTPLLLAAIFVASQTGFENEADYREEMQEIDHAFAVLSEQRAVRQGPELEREASRLSELFSNVEDFWNARGEEEAASFARMARKGADEAGKAARDGNEQSLDAAIDTVAASCEGCHKEPLDKYRFPLPE